MLWELDILRILFGLVFLGNASISDLKYRKVVNLVWLIMGMFGLIILEIQLINDKVSWGYHLIQIPILIIFLGFFLDTSIPKGGIKRKLIFWGVLYSIASLLVIYQTYTYDFDSFNYSMLVSIVVMLVVYRIFYILKILHGKADASALMALSILVPLYPKFWGLPILQMDANKSLNLELVFPFSLVVLLNAVIILLFVPLALGVYNASKRNFEIPQCFFGYKINLRLVKTRFVWLIEKIINGQRVIILTPKRAEENLDEEIEKLGRFGIKEVWVTPKIPFILPLTIGFVISVLIGNILFGIIEIIG